MYYGLNPTYLFSAHEKQMLDRMRHSWHTWVVAEAADVDVHCRRGLVGFGIVNEQNLELVGQLDDSVCAIIEQWFVEAVGEAFDARGSAVKHWFSHVEVLSAEPECRRRGCIRTRDAIATESTKSNSCAQSVLVLMSDKEARVRLAC